MLRFSSLFDGTPAADIALDALQEDMRAARLTWQYRFYYQLRPIIPLSLRRILQHCYNHNFLCIYELRLVLRDRHHLNYINYF